MAFSLQEVKRKSHTKQTEVKQCHFYLKNEMILTENTRYAFWKYVEFRLTKRHRGKFDVSTFSPMVEELLEYCCGKPYVSISRQDVINNENSILYEIKKAIFYGATRCLYDRNNTVIDASTIEFKDTIDEPKRISEDVNLDIEEVEDYFKDLVIC